YWAFREFLRAREAEHGRTDSTQGPFRVLCSAEIRRNFLCVDDATRLTVAIAAAHPEAETIAHVANPATTNMQACSEAALECLGSQRLLSSDRAAEAVGGEQVEQRVASSDPDVDLLRPPLPAQLEVRVAGAVVGPAELRVARAEEPPREGTEPLAGVVDVVVRRQPQRERAHALLLEQLDRLDEDPVREPARRSVDPLREQ